MADRVDWTLEQGAEFTRTLVYKNDNGNPIDITGHTPRMDIRHRQDKDSPLIHDLDGEGHISITNGPGGEITIQIPDDVTDGFNFRTAWYDVELDPGSDDTIRMMQGEITLDRGVTS